MGPVETAIRGCIRSGQSLNLTSSGKPFRVGDFYSDGIDLLLGQGERPTFLPWTAFELIPEFIAANGDAQGWVPAGGTDRVDGQLETLDAHLKQYTGTSTSRWVAALLLAAGIVDVRNSPVRVRLLG